jgi:surfactin synthase thioesterase subunit
MAAVRRTAALVCLPHAGGSGTAFHPWRSRLADLVEVIPVEPAGHGRRSREPLPRTFGEAMCSLRDRVERHAHRRYGLFGHSLGALFAFEAARHLTAAGTSPALLIVSGRNGPSRTNEGPPCHALPDEAFLQALARFGGVPPEILAEESLLDFFRPLLRADMRIAERYERRPGHPLHCPIVAIFASGDPLVSPAGVAAWREETSAGCRLVEVPGGHFSIRSERYLSALREGLGPLAAPYRLDEA